MPNFIRTSDEIAPDKEIIVLSSREDHKIFD